ncbi:MAG: hypothetical protein GY718_18165, partial [Lentisphaerae bacterium]|nr:hypothetical protein [Lentisphaerota bacterium]
MGWSGGAEVFDRIIDVVKPVIDGLSDAYLHEQEEIYREIIDTLRDADWDTL